jgi:hypothetical protein
VAEVFVEFLTLIKGPDGRRYAARACGGEVPGGLWQGWIEFIPVGNGEVLRSPRETTQPNRQDTEYWATGLTPVYLEGALHRALTPLPKRVPPPKPQPAYDEPAPDFVEPEPAPKSRESILNPFSVYQKGEALLRRQLGALSSWHLANIAEAYALVDEGTDPTRLSQSTLIELIVSGVKRREEQPAAK